MKKVYLILLVTLIFSNSFSQSLQWASRMGGNSFSWGKDIALDAAGNVYSTGHFLSTVDFDPGSGTYNLSAGGEFNIYVSKLDASGNFVWAKMMGGSEADYGRSIAVDNNGNVYTTGTYQITADFDPGSGTFELSQTMGSGGQAFISKLNSSGDFVWAKHFDGSGIEIPNGIEIDVSGNIYITGYFTSTVDFDPGVGVFELTVLSGEQDIFVCKLDASGNFIWAKNVGSFLADQGYALALDNEANVYLAGAFQGTSDFNPGPTINNLTSAGDYDIFICKLDSSGDYIWARSMGGTSEDVAKSIAVDDIGNVYSTGYFKGTSDFDPGVDTFEMTSASIGNYDIFISKLDTGGNFLWAKNIGSTDEDIGEAVVVDNSGYVYTTGSFKGTVDFNPGSGTDNHSANWIDFFVSKLSPSGDYVSAITIGGGSDDVGASIVLDNLANIYLTGYIYETVDFDPDTGTYILTSAGSFDIFVAKYGSGPVSISENLFEGKISAYPNPAKQNINIKLDKEYSDIEVSLWDLTGRLISTKTFPNAEDIHYDLNGADGVYLLKIRTTSGERAVIRVIKG